MDSAQPTMEGTRAGIEISRAANPVTFGASVAVLVLLVAVPSLLGVHDEAQARSVRLGFGVLLLLVVWVRLATSGRSVLLAPDAGQVQVRRRNFLLQSRTATFPLSQFESVASYIEPGLFRSANVVLLEKGGRRAIDLDWYDWDSPKWLGGFYVSDVEPEPARRLREDVARACGLADGGFLGSHPQFEQVR